jgi:hypothetical protein
MFNTGCYLIFASLISKDCAVGTEHDLKLVMNENCDVMVFASRERARQWAIDHMTPDWNWLILPFQFVEISEITNG